MTIEQAVDIYKTTMKQIKTLSDLNDELNLNNLECDIKAGKYIVKLCGSDIAKLRYVIRYRIDYYRSLLEADFGLRDDEIKKRLKEEGQDE